MHAWPRLSRFNSGCLADVCIFVRLPLHTLMILAISCVHECNVHAHSSIKCPVKIMAYTRAKIHLVWEKKSLTSTGLNSHGFHFDFTTISYFHFTVVIKNFFPVHQVHECCRRNVMKCNHRPYTVKLCMGIIVCTP